MKQQKKSKTLSIYSITKGKREKKKEFDKKKRERKKKERVLFSFLKPQRKTV